MQRSLKYALIGFGLNSVAMLTCIGVGQLTGLDGVNKAAMGLAWTELALYTLVIGISVYNCCCRTGTPTTQSAVSDNLELGNQQGAPESAVLVSSLAENRPGLSVSSKTSKPAVAIAEHSSAVTYTPLRRVSV